MSVPKEIESLIDSIVQASSVEFEGYNQEILSQMNGGSSELNKYTGRILYFHLVAEQHLDNFFEIACQDFDPKIIQDMRFGQKLNFLRSWKSDFLGKKLIEDLNHLNNLRNELAHQNNRSETFENYKKIFLKMLKDSPHKIDPNDNLPNLVGYTVLGILTQLSVLRTSALSKLKVQEKIGIQSKEIELLVLQKVSNSISKSKLK